MPTLNPNAQRLLRALITAGPAYRADLSRTLDVSRATVTNLTNRLSADGWVEETDPEPGSLKNLIGTTTRLGVLASVMFHVDTCTATLAALDGRILKESTLRSLGDLPPEQRAAAGAGIVDSLLVELGLAARDLRALHLAVDTQMDAQSGDVYSQRASSRWYGTNPKRFFAERFDVPVHAQNTARLEGLAECLWGSARDDADVLYVDVSHGITSGHIVEGIIRSGARGGSGEIGHTVYDWDGPLCTCGNSGCLMQYASIPAMLRDLGTGSGRNTDWAGFAALARNSDPSSLAIARRAADVLGRMLVNTCHIVAPAVVVVSGEVPRTLPGFVDDVAAVLRQRTLPLLGRHLRVVGPGLEDPLAPTARAGIVSLRAIDEVVSAAISV